jgi:drug/metabolite transporter (DMT)-like permease
MDWVWAALGSAIGFAAVTVLDKIILERHVPSAGTFIVFASFMQLPSAFVPLAFVPFPGYPVTTWAFAIGSGAGFGLSLVLMFNILRRHDVSLVTAVFQTAPVFVAIFAVFFLSENLSAWHWVAIIVTVTGAVVISLRRSPDGGRPQLGTWFFIMLVSSALYAAGLALSKAALDDGMSLWNLHTVRSVSITAVMVGLTLRGRTFGELRVLVRNVNSVSLIVFTEAGLAFAAMYLTTLALTLGPVSLATTVMASRPLFVFLFGILLSLGVLKVLSEPLDRASLMQRGLAIAMIVAGVSAISLL